MQGKVGVTFDAQCDLAAVVYGPDDDPDRLFNDFAEDLSRSGRRPIGLIQVGRACRSEDPGLGAVVLPGGDVVSLVEDLPARTPGCRLDAGRLTDIAERLADALARGSDLVIINRFGRSEAAGGGLAGLIIRAIGADIPVLIAVPEHRFAALIKFADGMNVRLACRREALDRWWRSVAGQPERPLSGSCATFCEIGK
jgi:Protein of unknown function (DUF2478)